MKYIILLTLSVAITFFPNDCVAQKKKMMYDFPTAMAPAVQAEFAKQCDKGKILYDINCAGCHNTIVKGKVTIPDFTPEQLVAYELRVSNPKHENDISETKITAEELGLITTFLTYKKKNQAKIK